MHCSSNNYLKTIYIVKHDREQPNCSALAEIFQDSNTTIVRPHLERKGMRLPNYAVSMESTGNHSSFEF